MCQLNSQEEVDDVHMFSRLFAMSSNEFKVVRARKRGKMQLNAWVVCYDSVYFARDSMSSVAGKSAR